MFKKHLEGTVGTALRRTTKLEILHILSKMLCIFPNILHVATDQVHSCYELLIHWLMNF